MHRRIIEVVNYDPNWPTLFEQESALLSDALGENVVTIEHIPKPLEDACFRVRGEFEYKA